MTGPPAPDTFLSGESGTRSGVRAAVADTIADVAIDLIQWLARTERHLDRLAEAEPRREVLVLSAYRRGAGLARAVAQLSSRRHAVTLALGAVEDVDPALAANTVAAGLGGGKFENLDRVLEHAPPPAAFDWTLVVDDDVVLPTRFLDRFVAVCGRLQLGLAQPALTRRSHAAWRVTRRRPASVARETRFVEIGPVTAFARIAAAELLPFPPLRFGWGLDLHWAALARERRWRVGIVDALPIHHERAPVARAYDRAAAIGEGRDFLASRPYLPAPAAQETLVTYRRPSRLSNAGRTSSASVRRSAGRR